MSLIGLDIGTSGLKGILINEDGGELGAARIAYQQTYPKPGWCVQDPDVVEAALRDVLAQLGVAARRAGDPVRAMAMAQSGNEYTPVDASGRALAHTIMSMDSRGVEQAARCAKLIGAQALFDTTGLVAHPMHPLVRALWLRDEEPELFARTHRLLGWGELLAGRMGAPAVSDFSMASSTMAFDLTDRTWSAEILGACDLDATLFAPAVSSGTVLGGIAASSAAELDLPAGVQIVTGGFDQPMAALGSGQLRPGQASVGTGSWEALVVVLDRPGADPSLLAGGYESGCYVTSDDYYVVANNSGAGSVIRWLHDLVDAPRLAGPGDGFDAMLRDAPDGPSGLLVLPHFAGSYNPWMDPQARGVIVGLTLDTGIGDLAKGFLEGICFEFRANLERLRAAGIEVDDLVATGGGASPAWCQLRADITGMPVGTVSVTETGCLAAACLAGVAVGQYADIAEPVSRFVRPSRYFEPDPDSAVRYAEIFDDYQQLYPAVRSFRPHR